LTARFGGQPTDLHRHETYAVGLTLWGAQSFHYRGALQTSRGGRSWSSIPDEAHDGHAGVDDGFAYRMLYVDPASVWAALDAPARPSADVVPTIRAGRPAGRGFADFPQPLEPARRRCRRRAPGRRLVAAATIARARGAGPTRHRAVARARDSSLPKAHRTWRRRSSERVTGLDRLRWPAFPRGDRHVAASLPGRQAARGGAEMIADGMALSRRRGDGVRRPEPLTRHFSARFGLTPAAGRAGALSG